MGLCENCTKSVWNIFRTKLQFATRLFWTTPYLSEFRLKTHFRLKSVGNLRKFRPKTVRNSIRKWPFFSSEGGWKKGFFWLYHRPKTFEKRFVYSADHRPNIIQITLKFWILCSGKILSWRETKGNLGLCVWWGLVRNLESGLLQHWILLCDPHCTRYLYK